MQLRLPPYSPLTLGANKDGRKLNTLAYICERMSDGKFLNAKSATWSDAPVLNSMSERGRTGDWTTFSPLRGTYVQVDVPDFPDEENVTGLFSITYHDRSKDNVVVGSAVFQNGMKVRGLVKISEEPATP